MLTSDDVRRTYIDFFTRRGHVEIARSLLDAQPLPTRQQVEQV